MEEQKIILYKLAIHLKVQSRPIYIQLIYSINRARSLFPKFGVRVLSFPPIVVYKWNNNYVDLRKLKSK